MARHWGDLCARARGRDALPGEPADVPRPPWVPRGDVLHLLIQPHPRRDGRRWRAVPPRDRDHYREMWEKVVFNLLSNAFKHTFEGGITVTLRWCGGHVELTVADSGVGIPEAELSRLFERFHRVKGAQSRTHEGTGIGLALVQELIRAHGGTVSIESQEGQGSTFTVTAKAGRAHLPPDRVGAERMLASTATRAAAYVEETLRWLPNAPA